jgi:hypothetical protein
MLELTGIALKDGQAHVTYNVRHNVGRLRTTLEQTLELRVDVATGKVRGALHITDLETENVEGAREKLAVWCERLAAALRGVVRMEGDLPLYERKPFNLASQPLWLQQEFARLVQTYVDAQTDEDRAAIKLWLKDHPMNLVSDMVEVAQCEAERLRENAPKHPY